MKKKIVKEIVHYVIPEGEKRRNTKFMEKQKLE